MHVHDTHAFPAPHSHVFLGDAHRRNERRTWIVIAITASVMVLEIVAGSLFGSMALLADGWHMSTHAAAMLITALAYLYARRHAHDARFTFGTGRVGDLAAFASAVVLAVVALLIAWESAQRLVTPQPIHFREAIAVAVFGLVVNLVCAFLLRDDHDHEHGHSHGHYGHHGHAHHGHAHDHGHRHDEPLGPTRDNNLRAAYLHVLTDALTSVFAIAALTGGSLYGWLWLDPVIGIVGALVVAHWSWGLLRDAGAVLVDYVPAGESLPREIRHALEDDEAEITDLHVWQVGPGHHGGLQAAAGAHRRARPRHRRGQPGRGLSASRSGGIT